MCKLYSTRNVWWHFLFLECTNVIYFLILSFIFSYFFFKQLTTYSVYILRVWTHAIAHVWTRETFSGVISLLPPFGGQGLNSSSQPWWQSVTFTLWVISAAIKGHYFSTERSWLYPLCVLCWDYLPGLTAQQWERVHHWPMMQWTRRGQHWVYKTPTTNTQVSLIMGQEPDKSKFSHDLQNHRPSLLKYKIFKILERQGDTKAQCNAWSWTGV